MTRPSIIVSGPKTRAPPRLGRPLGLHGRGPRAIDDHTGLVVVAHSLGGFTAPLVCARVSVDLLIPVAGMIPAPGETGSDWWTTTGHALAAGDEEDVCYHDLPPALAAEARARKRDQAGTPMEEPWPLSTWPDVPTRFLLCRDDRMFPAAWMRRIVGERLGIVLDEMDGGHYVALSRPGELADRLEAYGDALRQPT